MLKSAVKALLGSRHKREAKKLQPLIDEINEIFEGLSSLTDDQLRAKTDEFRAYIEEETAELKGRIAELREQKRKSEDPGDRERLSLEINGLEKELQETVEDALEDLLPEAFAVVKDACRRPWCVFTAAPVPRWSWPPPVTRVSTPKDCRSPGWKMCRMMSWFSMRVRS